MLVKNKQRNTWNSWKQDILVDIESYNPFQPELMYRYLASIYLSDTFIQVTDVNSDTGQAVAFQGEAHTQRGLQVSSLAPPVYVLPLNFFSPTVLCLE